MASSSRQEIEAEIRRQIEVQGEAELKHKGREFSTEVMEYGISISPYDPDDENLQHYKDSFKLRARNLRGRLPSWRITNTDPLATVIEHGSDAGRPQGGSSPMWAVFARMAFRFGGTPDHDGDDEI
jgi:hypothetical protein